VQGPAFDTSLNILDARAPRETLYANAPLLTDPQQAEEPDPTIRQETAASGNTALEAVEQGRAFFMYTIEEGENLQRIADKFALREATITNNNFELEPEHFSEAGRQIIMLSTDGMLHTLKSGEDLIFVADLYGSTPEAIVNYAPNGLAAPDDVFVGKVVVVPDGLPPVVETPEDTTQAAAEAAVEAAQEEQEQEEPEAAEEPESDEAPAESPPEEAPPSEPPPDDGASVSGWVWPVSGCGITRGVGNGHSGIDIDLFCNPGATVVAAASGTVIHAGWDGAYGNSVVIDHGNGLFSRYAHLSSVSVSVGQSVGAGQTIGVSGTSGNANGEHLHFEIRSGSPYGAILDPLAYLP
jgi:murein DD-endopeptidase MepM/ murein hydrolase activator NlpD